MLCTLLVRRWGHSRFLLHLTMVWSGLYMHVTLIPAWIIQLLMDHRWQWCEFVNPVIAFHNIYLVAPRPRVQSPKRAILQLNHEVPHRRQNAWLEHLPLEAIFINFTRNGHEAQTHHRRLPQTPKLEKSVGEHARNPTNVAMTMAALHKHRRTNTRSLPPDGEQ